MPKKNDKRKKRAKQKAKQNRINRNSGCQGKEMIPVPLPDIMKDENGDKIIAKVVEEDKEVKDERWKRFVEGEWS